MPPFEEAVRSITSVLKRFSEAPLLTKTTSKLFSLILKRSTVRRGSTALWRTSWVLVSGAISPSRCPQGAGFSRRGCSYKLLHPFHSFLTSSFCLPALSTMFHSKKTLYDTSVFSSLLAADFCLTGHYPVFSCTTTVLYIVLLALCDCLQTQCVCRTLHPVSGKDGILVAEVPRGFQHASSARTSPRRVVGLARPNQSAGRALP